MAIIGRAADAFWTGFCVYCIHMFEIEAKKSLGQNFLKNPGVIGKIVDAGEIGAGDTVLEIGPGTGAMTQIILDRIEAVDNLGDKKDKAALEEARPTRLIVIEKDRRAIPVLEAKFKAFLDNGTLRIIEGDFLEMEMGQIIGRIHEKKAKIGAETGEKGAKSAKKQHITPYKIIANIPYYITGAIIRKVMETDLKPKTAIFLVQKEVAERITRKGAGSGVKKSQKSNILAESIAAYGRTEYLFTVVRGNFVPMPKVDSAAIRISDISDRRFEESGVSEELFFEVMKAGFAHKRKKLSSNLKEYLEKKTSASPAASISDIFSQKNINPDARAEEITTDMWFDIAKSIKAMI